jgi:hypothetical protein
MKRELLLAIDAIGNTVTDYQKYSVAFYSSFFPY